MGNRIEFIDAIKGFAVFLMVIGHTLEGFYSDVDGGIWTCDFKISGIWYFIYTFHMPLFFFISGYLFDSKQADWNIKYCLKSICRRSVQLIIPAISFLVIGLLLSSSNNKNLWFLRTLFEIYSINVCILFIASKFEKKEIVIAALQILSYLAFKILNSKLEGTTIFQVIRFDCLSGEFIYFYLGYLANKCKLTKQLQDHNYIYTITLMLWISIFVIIHKYDYSSYKLSVLMAICGIVSTFGVFTLNNYKELTSGIVRNYFQKIGANTLPIYLLSSYFIPQWNGVRELFDCLPFSEFCNSFLIQMALSTAIAIMVSYVSLVLANVFTQSRWLGLLLFGRFPKN